MDNKFNKTPEEMMAFLDGVAASATKAGLYTGSISVSGDFRDFRHPSFLVSKVKRSEYYSETTFEFVRDHDGQKGGEV